VAYADKRESRKYYPRDGSQSPATTGWFRLVSYSRSIFTQLRWQIREYCFLSPHTKKTSFDRRVVRMKGYYHSRMAPLCFPDAAGNFYVEAASKYPEDGENHPCKFNPVNYLTVLPSVLDFVDCGVKCLFRCGTPLRETHPARHSKNEENLGCFCEVQTGQR